MRGKENQSGTRFGPKQIKLAAMGGLLVVGMLLWARLLFLKPQPRTAVADNPALALASDNPSPNKPATPTARRQVVRVALPGSLERDPFLLDPNAFEKVQKPEAPATPAPVVAAPPSAPEETAGVEVQPTELSAAEKSRLKRADEERRIEAVRRAASGMVLQSTVTGADERALINGQRVRPGQSVKGFTLKQVQAREVTLVMDGIEVRLSM